MPCHVSQPCQNQRNKVCDENHYLPNVGVYLNKSYNWRLTIFFTLAMILLLTTFLPPVSCVSTLPRNSRVFLSLSRPSLSPYGHLFKETCQLKHSLRYFFLWVLNSASRLSSLYDLSIFNCQLQLTHQLFSSHFWNVSFSHVFAILLQQFLATYKSIVPHFH